MPEPDPERPAAVNQCVIAIQRLRPDMDGLTAEAFCEELHERGVLGDSDDADLPLTEAELEALADTRTAQDDLDPAVEECVLSMKADQPDMDKSTMIAICTDMQDKGALEAYLEGADGDGDRQLAQFRNPGSIQRVETDAGVQYKGVMVLAPGIWTDAGSGQSIDYSGDGIRASAENWIDQSAWRERREKVPTERAAINFLHGPALYGADSLDEVGHIPTDSVVVDDQNRLFADLVLHGDSPQSETAIQLMDEVLEAADDPGREAPPVGPSVEIADDRVEVDQARGLAELQEAWFTGIGIVFNPASKPVELDQQVAERAVAMSAPADTAAGGGLIYRPADGGTLNTASRHAGGMSDKEREEVARLLEDIEEAMADVTAVLQENGELAELFDLTVQYQQEGHDLQAPVTEFVAWMEENTQLTQADVQDTLDAYLEAVDADELEATPVEGLRGWLDEQGASGESEGDGGEDDAQETMSAGELEEAVNTISQYADQLETVKEMLADYEETHGEIDDRLEDVEKRLAAYEEAPEGRSMTSGGGQGFGFEADGEGEGEPEHEDVIFP